MKLILDYIWPFLLRSFPLLCAFFSFFLWRFNFLLCFPVHVTFITFIIFIWHWPIHTYWLPLPQNSEVTSQSSHLIYLPFPIRYNTIVIILKMLRKMPQKLTKKKEQQQRTYLQWHGMARQRQKRRRRQRMEKERERLPSINKTNKINTQQKNPS